MRFRHFLVTNTDLDHRVATVDDLAAATAGAAHVRGAPIIEAVRHQMEIAAHAVDLVHLLREHAVSYLFHHKEQFLLVSPPVAFLKPTI
ncbi:hypothetical protein ANCDUO_18970 [Ancylostoma duodenale]|uniref:Uncharacterized protein n=1 Tax=Ancylostoma duodenale TaxID=51022 RepID=A0A0C2C3U0_9BILA|nr:hypothetical protein ANCDUO_18970 [Ancylostoma duodenale]